MNCARCGLILHSRHECPDRAVEVWSAGLMQMLYGRDWKLRSESRMCDASAVEYGQCWDANGSPVEAA